MAQQIAMVGTYPQTQCGIATFTRSLASSMSRLGCDVRILRLSSEDVSPNSPEILGIHRGQSDLIRSVHALNRSDLVILQHEFGIFGGQDGEEVLDIVGGLRVPLMTVLHTVPALPTSRQRRIIQGLVNASDAIVVLSNAARRLLMKTYDVNAERVRTIPHGAPPIADSHRRIRLSARPRLMTWGLIGPGKGLEWGIAALANLRDLEPMPDYYIVGQTHPKVQARDGFAYRESLQELAANLGVEERVHFLDQYLDTDHLFRTVAKADVFLLPYDTREQVVSGVLTEAMVAGGPIIATRFPHAEELLGDGTGILVNQGDPLGIAEAVRRLLRSEQEHERMRQRTLRKGDGYLWSTVGAAFVTLVNEVIADRHGLGRQWHRESVPA